MLLYVNCGESHEFLSPITPPFPPTYSNLCNLSEMLPFQHKPAMKIEFHYLPWAIAMAS